MGNRLFIIITTILGLSGPAAWGCEFPGSAPGLGQYDLVELAAGFSRPIDLQPLPGGGMLVAEQAGRLVEWKDGERRVVLDIRSRVSALQGANDERGLLGMTLHPEFARNGYVFLNFTRRSSDDTRIARYTMDRNGFFGATTERVILDVDQYRWNHNGGGLAFGPDGYLYIALGDGGGAGDTPNNSQNLQSMLGKILRIDVDTGNPYRVPADNPQWSTRGAHPEIYAYGLRNPWRISFDSVTGELWAGDVGQGRYEEVNIIEKGGNYGWRLKEGYSCFNPRNNCERPDLIDPVHVYPHSDGVSITGGYVYRGTRLNQLTGTYLYGDFSSGTIWGLKNDGEQVQVDAMIQSNVPIASFGQDQQGEIYVLGLNGAIYGLEARPQMRSFPLTVTDTGCFEADGFTPTEGVTPYLVNSPLWSDGSQKDRFVFVPNGARIEFDGDQPQFPDDTVLIKNFYLIIAGSRELLETRFLVKKPNGFVGYSYYWQEGEGRFLGGSTERPVEGVDEFGPFAFNYFYPSTAGCRRCHTNSVDESIGFSLNQLNRGNQLADLAAAGILAPVSSPPTGLPSYNDGSESISDRVRSYLHSQCAHCHNPTNRGGQIDLDLRFGTSLADMKACNTAPEHGDLDLQQPKLIIPGDKERSLVWHRIQTLIKGERMPPLASHRLDQAGIDLVGRWIDSLQDCQQ